MARSYFIFLVVDEVSVMAPVQTGADDAGIGGGGGEELFRVRKAYRTVAGGGY